MKLPKREEKFTVDMTYEGDEHSFYGFVVSGIHIEIRRQDEDSVWYYVCADKVYDDLFHGTCLHVASCLEHALDFIREHLVPYEEPEEKAEEESIVEGGNSNGDLGLQRETGLGLLVIADHDCRNFSGRRQHAPIGTAKDTLGVPAHLGGVSLA